MAIDRDELEADRLLAEAGYYSLTSEAIDRSDRRYHCRAVTLGEMGAARCVMECIQDCSMRTIISIAHRARASERELDCVRLLCDDYSQRDIAEIIGWSQSTVRDDLAAILARIKPLIDSYPWYGLAEILAELMTLRANWPSPT